MNTPKITDTNIERTVSTQLRMGVLISGFIVLAGGVYYVVRHHAEELNFRAFRGEPSVDRLIREIVLGAIHLRARSIIQCGILALIATPILRVVFSMVGFVLESDWTYVLITSIVLGVLLCSLISGAVGG